VTHASSIVRATRFRRPDAGAGRARAPVLAGAPVRAGEPVLAVI
jgi:hypothetical protein